MSTCMKRTAATGDAYPRTCPHCQLGGICSDPSTKIRTSSLTEILENVQRAHKDGHELGSMWFIEDGQVSVAAIESATAAKGTIGGIVAKLDASTKLGKRYGIEPAANGGVILRAWYGSGITEELHAFTTPADLLAFLHEAYGVPQNRP